MRRSPVPCRDPDGQIEVGHGGSAGRAEAGGAGLGIPADQ
jgi:hypothetical protein